MAVVKLMPSSTNVRTLHDRRHQLGAVFVTNVFLCSKSCPATTDITGPPVPTQNLRHVPVPRQFVLYKLSSYHGHYWSTSSHSEPQTRSCATSVRPIQTVQLPRTLLVHQFPLGTSDTFLCHVSSSYTKCPATTDITGLPVPTRNLRHVPLPRQFVLYKLSSYHGHYWSTSSHSEPQTRSCATSVRPIQTVQLPRTLLVYQFPLGTSDTFLCHVSSFYTNCRSGRCVTATSSVCNQLDVFRRQTVTLSETWYCCATLLQGVLINCLSTFICLLCVCFVVFVSFVCCSLSVVICVCVLCCLCSWPSGCWLGTLINQNWIVLLLQSCACCWVQHLKFVLSVFLRLQSICLHI
jgi:hypothetical protein